jgi:BACON domain-containing protein/fibronectin type III domain protein
MNEVKRSLQCPSWTVRDVLLYTAVVLGVSVCLLPDAWALQATPTTLSFQAVQGGTSPTSQIVNVLKSNNHAVGWSGTDNAAWLSISPTSGSITRAAQISVSVNPAGLAAGTYAASVTITAAQGGSISVPVTLTVTPGSAPNSTSSSTTSSTSTPTTTSSSTTPTTTSTSQTASLSWSPPTNSTGVAGYNMYVGTASGVYGPPINVGNVTSYVANNLVIGNTYYFVVKDYNTSGVESAPSNEVSKSIY